MRGTKKKAFTLIEVLLMVAIIGTLVALIIPAYTNLLEKSRVNHVITEIVKISRALDDFLADNGTLPETLDELIQKLAVLLFRPSVHRLRDQWPFHQSGNLFLVGRERLIAIEDAHWNSVSLGPGERLLHRSLCVTHVVPLFLQIVDALAIVCVVHSAVKDHTNLHDLDESIASMP